MCKDVLQTIEEKKIVAILRGLSFSQSMKTIEALIESGIVNIEVTLNTPNAIECIKKALEEFGDVANIGAGTVKNEEDAKKAVQAGARFLLTPNLSINAVEYANTENVLIIPGVLTPTEIVTAQDLGCKMVKIFPISAVNKRYIKEIKGPLDDIKVMAVGGVGLENIEQYLSVGADAFGLGSSLIKTDLVKEERYDLLKEHFRKYVDLLNRF